MLRIGRLVSYMLRAPESIHARPIRLAVGWWVTLSSNSWPIGPSITALVSSGITISEPTDPIASVSIRASCQR